MVTYFEEGTKIENAPKHVYMKILCPKGDELGIEDVTE
jgi:hypothetical protein